MLRPQKALADMGKRYPDAWRLLDYLREGRGKTLPAWPDWCFTPMAAHHAVISKTINPRLVIEDVGIMAALDAWRITQTIYRFDEIVFDSLVHTDLRKIPNELFYRLPEWCVYIETPVVLSPPDDEYRGYVLHGFFAHLEWDAGTGRTELRLVLDGTRDADEDVFMVFPIHLGYPTLIECIEAMLAECKRNTVGNWVSVGSSQIAILAAPLLALLLYLCSDKADIGGSPVGFNDIKPKKTKKGMRWFPAPRQTVREVGFNIGQQLRLAHRGGGGSSNTGIIRAAHVRKAHWHLYWTGQGRSTPRINWVAPTVINPRADEMAITIKKVT